MKMKVEMELERREGERSKRWYHSPNNIFLLSPPSLSPSLPPFPSSLSQLAHIKKRKEVIHELKFSPNGRYLAVGSNDNFVDVYTVADSYKHVACCTGIYTSIFSVASPTDTWDITYIYLSYFCCNEMYVALGGPL